MPTGFQWPEIGAFRRGGDPSSTQMNALKLFREINELPGSEAYGAKVQEYKIIIDNFEKAYQGATTPPEKEAVRQNALRWRAELPPILSQGLAARFAESPFNAAEMRKEWWMKNNPMPQISADPEKYPAMYAEQRFRQERWKKSMLKNTEGIDYDMPGLISANAEQYAILGTDGVPRLRPVEAVNSNLDKIAEGMSTTAEYLIASGGYGPPTVQKFQVVQDGEAREVLATGRFNVINQTMSWKKADLGAAPRGTRSFKLPPTEGEKADIEGALMHANAGERPDSAKVSASTYLMYDEIRSAQREYKDDPEGYSTWLSEYLSNYSPNYTFVVRAGMEKEDPTFGLARMKLKGGQFAVRVPGKEEVVTFRDGKRGLFIVSRFSDTVHDAQGNLIGRGVEETVSRMSGMTIQEFTGLTPAPEGLPEAKPRPQEVLPEEVAQ